MEQKIGTRQVQYRCATYYCHLATEYHTPSIMGHSTTTPRDRALALQAGFGIKLVTCPEKRSNYGDGMNKDRSEESDKNFLHLEGSCFQTCFLVWVKNITEVKLPVKTYMLS